MLLDFPTEVSALSYEAVLISPLCHLQMCFLLVPASNFQQKGIQKHQVITSREEIFHVLLLQFFYLFPSLCHLTLLFAQGICCGESLLRKILSLLIFSFAGASILSLLAAETSSASMTKSPNALHQRQCQLFFLCCLSCTLLWHQK